MWSKDDIGQGSYTPPKEQPVFTAEMARRRASGYSSVGGELYKKVTLQILKEIEDAASKGGQVLYVTRFFETLDYTDRAAVQGHLEALGYKVESVFDQRDGDYHKVLW